MKKLTQILVEQHKFFKYDLKTSDPAELVGLKVHISSIHYSKYGIIEKANKTHVWVDGIKYSRKTGDMVADSRFKPSLCIIQKSLCPYKEEDYKF